jgi:membrane protein implicated in regulation of membrane protease activity
MPWWLWTVTAIVCIAAEIHFTRDFSLLCIGLAASILAGITGLFPAVAISRQWFLFSILCVGLLVASRKFWLRLRPSREGNTTSELDYLVGEIATASEELPAGGFGKAELRGTTWMAHNAQPEAVAKGQRCRVARVQGLTIWIEPES